MSEIKTKKTTASVAGFINNVPNEQRREDAKVILKLMEEITGEPPAMWGPSIIGFGKYHYKYDSGHEADMCMMGFSPRKDYLVIYLSCDGQNYDDLLSRLGPHKISKACLYIKHLSKIDMSVLKKLIVQAYKDTKVLIKEKGW